MKTIKLYITLLVIFSIIAVENSFGRGDDTLRVASYNLLNFPGNDVATRIPYFRKVIHSMNPDILVAQEMTSQAGTSMFLNDVMNAYVPGLYSAAPFRDGPDTDNEIFFKSDRVSLITASYLPTALRDIAEYVLSIIGSSDTIRIYSLHLKASTGSDNEQKRLAEATILREHLNALPPGSKFMIVGDFNIYRSDEPAFQKLIGNETDNDGRVKDPLNAVGAWNNNFSFRFIHTQSPRVRSFGGGSTGGLDDRFDMMLTSSSLEANLIVSSYTSYGNDGNHFNDSINRLPNTAVPDSVADALHYASDHLPIYADYQFSTGILAIHPRMIRDTLYPGQIKTEKLHITNDDSMGTMSYTLLGNAPWLSASPVLGQISNGDTDEITLTLDAAGLTTGSYKSNLTIVDPDHGVVLLTIDVVIDELTHVEIERTDLIPSAYSLAQNYPNPFNPSTSIQYAVPVQTQVRLAVYNILGQEIERLVQEKQIAGTYRVYWDAQSLTSGVYFYKLQTDDFIAVKRMILTK
jgi:endonuclease/exonuclease/phosphatase family metal-dependent hydrolase